MCYYCDEVFVPGHKCKKKQLYMLMGEEDNEPDEISLNNSDERET